MKRVKIAEALSQAEVGQILVVKGWVRAFRSNRFIQLNDGSTINNLQAVVDFEKYDEAILKKIKYSKRIMDLKMKNTLKLMVSRVQTKKF